VLGLVLALSVAGLAVGPLLYASGRVSAPAASALDGLVLGLVPPLVLVRLAPHAYDELGAAAPCLLAAGYAFVWLVERRGHGARGARFAATVIVSALAAHAFADGAALAVASRAAGRAGASGGALAAALLLHRLPEGLVLTRAIVPALGWPAALVRLGLMAAATAAGALAGRTALDVLPEGPFDALMALSFGALLRWVVHTHEPPPRGAAARAAGGSAFALGVALALALPAPDSLLARAQPRELTFGESFVPLFVECAPALLAGVALGAVAARCRGGRPRGALGGLAAAWRSEATARALGAGRAGAARRGAGLVASWALASGALAPDALLVGARLLGAPWALARTLLAGAAAAAVGALVALASRRAAVPPASGAAAHDPLAGARPPGRPGPGGPPDRFGAFAAPARTADATRRAAVRAFDRFAPGWLTGLLLAAFAEAALRAAPAASAAIAAPLAAWPLAAAVALGGRLALPLAAVAVHKGLSPGVALGLLSLRLGAWPAALAALRREGGRPACGAFVAGSLAAAALAGAAADATLSRASVPEVHPLLAHAPPPLAWAAAAAALAGLVAGLARRGPRAWLRYAFARA
jgi:hypothetical protein